MVNVSKIFEKLLYFWIFTENYYQTGKKQQ